MKNLFRPKGTLASASDAVRLSAKDADWRYAGLSVLSMEPGGSRELELTGLESAVIPFSGSCSVAGDGFEFDLTGRSSVFEGTPDVAYLPLGTTAVIRTETGGRFAVATSVAEERRPAFAVRAAEVSREVRGAGQATRVIRGLLSADVPGPQRLIVVEVITPAGNWSSYPPHKHDEWSDSEVPIEEIYYFEIAGEQGFGLHRTYTLDDQIDETVTVRSGDVFLIPRGYHGPCVAAPGYDMYYLNVMAGPDPERRWMICNDPAHAWVIGTWEDMEPDPRAIERTT